VTPGRRVALLPGEYSVCRLPADAPLATAAVEPPAEGLVSVARSAEELSVVCDSSLAPAESERSDGWRALAVDGPLEHDEIGILASLAAPLATAEVPIFAVSTFLTDYLLVPAGSLESAREALRSAGWEIASPPR
jgi:uncharacterized protein